MESIESRIKEALQPIVPVVKPNVYKGAELTYIVFNYDERGKLHANGTAKAIIYSVQVHLFMPSNESPKELKSRIREALENMGTFPSIVNATDKDSQHYVFEFDAMGAA